MPDEGRADDVWGYVQTYYGSKEIAENFAQLAEAVPGVVERWIALRREIFADREGSALSPRMKELIATAIEVALCKTNPPPAFHARKAIDAGATVQEVAEAISVAIMLAGMVTYWESGRFALRAAEERAAELASKER